MVMPGELVELKHDVVDKTFFADLDRAAVRCLLTGERIIGVLVAAVCWRDVDETLRKKVVDALLSDLFEDDISEVCGLQRVFVIHVLQDDTTEPDAAGFWIGKIILVPEGRTYAKVKPWNPPRTS